MNCKKFSRDARTALMIAIFMLGTVALVPGAWAASKYRTLHRFNGGKNGSQPFSGLVFDSSGALYGTTYAGGTGSCLGHACGVVFKLSLNAKGRWTEQVLYRFNGEDGSNPQTASLIMDAQGNLYGTTEFGGASGCHANGCGVAFELVSNKNGSWTEKVLHQFTGDVGVNPVDNLIFDTAGNLYGTTSDWSNGFTGPGVVFKLSPNPDGSWTESILHTFDTEDGYNPSSGVIFDPDGNLYGTTIYGGDYNNGVVYRLSPNPDGSWTESVLHSFTGGDDGFRPQPGLIRDPESGTLYGVTAFGGPHGYGTVFQLAPNPDGTWTHSNLYAFQGGNDGGNPFARLTLAEPGTLYGTTHDHGAYGCGVVFKLTAALDGKWDEKVIHAFKNQPACEPFSDMILDSEGSLYGTTSGDGTKTFGSVFKITP